jgi:hypothetical protein
MSSGCGVEGRSKEGEGCHGRGKEDVGEGSGDRDLGDSRKAKRGRLQAG